MTETTMTNTNLITRQLKDSHVQYLGDFLRYIKTTTEHNRQTKDTIHGCLCQNQGIEDK